MAGFVGLDNPEKMKFVSHHIVERAVVDTLDGDYPWVFLNGRGKDDINYRPSGDRRKLLTEIFESQGIKRPRRS